MHRCCSVSGFWWNFSINLFISIWINGTGNKCLDSVNLIFQSWSVVAPCVWVKHDRLWQHLIALTHAPSNYHFNGVMMFMCVYWRWWRYQIMHTEREREKCRIDWVYAVMIDLVSRISHLLTIFMFGCYSGTCQNPSFNIEFRNNIDNSW